jgi:hypothetical protein
MPHLPQFRYNESSIALERSAFDAPKQMKIAHGANIMNKNDLMAICDAYFLSRPGIEPENFTAA